MEGGFGRLGGGGRDFGGPGFDFSLPPPFFDFPFDLDLDALLVAHGTPG